MNKKVIGFSNLDERNAFPIAVREGLERVASDHDDIELIVRNNDLDTELAKQYIDEFANHPVDVAMIFHGDERADFNLIAPLYKKGIPIISIEIRYPMTYFFGVDNIDMGTQAGEQLGSWIQQHWNGQIDKILIATSSGIVGEIPKRFDSALAALSRYTQWDRNNVLYLDSAMQREVIYDRTRAVFDSWKGLHHIAVICINDYVASGVLQAARDLGRESDIAVISYDGTQIAFDEFEKPHSRLITSPAFYPEQYGEHLIPLAQRILAGERVPQQSFITAICLTKNNYQQFLRKE